MANSETKEEKRGRVRGMGDDLGLLIERECL